MSSDKRYTVYKHTSPEGKVYIGCTGDKVETRWKKGYHHNVALTNDVEKMGWDNFKHEVISTNMDESSAYALEKELIHKYDSTNTDRGYNKSIGGKINSGIVRSDEYRKKMSELKQGEKHNFYGKHHTEESKREMSVSSSGSNHPMYGKHLSEETKRKLSESHRRENLSEETLNRMRAARLGKKLSDSTKRKLSEVNSKKVMCVETQKIYNSIKEAAKDTGCYDTNITAACNGRQKTAAGYHWTHIDKEKSDEKRL